MRATKPRVPDGPARRWREPRAGTFARSGTSTTARWSSSTAGSAGSAAPGSRITSRTDASTTCSSASTGPVVAQLQLVFLASFRWLGGAVPAAELDALFPALEEGGERRYPPSSCTTRRVGTGRSPTRSRALLDGARDDARRRQPVRHRPRHDPADREALRAAASACACSSPRTRTTGPAPAAQQFHHAKLLDAGVRILEYPTMLHAKAFVRDGEERARRHVQPRGVEPQAVLRDRPPAPVDCARGAVRGAVQRSGGGGVVPRARAHRQAERARAELSAILSPLL